MNEGPGYCETLMEEYYLILTGDLRCQLKLCHICCIIDDHMLKLYVSLRFDFQFNIVTSLDTRTMSQLLHTSH